MEKKEITSHLTKGLILGLLLSALAAAIYILVPDMSKHQEYGWISYLVIIGAMIWATMSYAKQMDGNVTFGNVFAHGFKTAAVMTLIIIAYTFISIKFIFPEMKDKAMEMARTQMENQGKMTDTQIDQAISMTSEFFMPFAIGGALIMYLLLGAIGSLIGAAFAKKNPNPQPFQ